MVKAVRVLVGAELLAAAVAGHAYSPGSGLSGTPHDWSTGDGTTVLLWKDRQGGATTYNTGTPWIDPATGRQGTTRIANGQCATCHTPQQAGSSTLLWNYTLQPVGYRWNDPVTTAGTRYPVFQGGTHNDDGSGNIVVGVVPGRTGIECSPATTRTTVRESGTRCF